MTNSSRTDVIATSIGLNKVSLDELKKELGLPNEAIFCGYLVYVENKDEFLGLLEETNLGTKRGFLGNPEHALKFDEFGDAYKAARREKNEIVVGLFDLGKQLMIYPIE